MTDPTTGIPKFRDSMLGDILIKTGWQLVQLAAMVLSVWAGGLIALAFRSGSVTAGYVAITALVTVVALVAVVFALRAPRR